MTRAAIAVLAVWGALYLVWAFVEWNLNAGAWSSGARYALAWIAVGGGVFLGSIAYKE